MDSTTIASQYNEASRGRAGGMTGVPLADDLASTGPVASFDSAQPPSIAALLECGLTSTANVIAGLDQAEWAAPSPCAGWTVRDVGNHLTGSIALLTRVADGGSVEPADFNPQRMASTDYLGTSPSIAFRAVAEHAVAAFTRPETLQRRFAFPGPDTPGAVLANICLLESLVHGWDIATGAGADYQPDSQVVAAVRGFAFAAIGDEQRRNGAFGPAQPTNPEADPLTTTLGHLGRRA